MNPLASNSETGWLPDCVYTGVKFETGLAFFANARGGLSRFSREPADLAAARRLPGQAVLPGLVNAHSHAFQRAIRGRTEERSDPQRDTFWTWREKMYHAAARLTDEDIFHTARMAFLEMALGGITTVGEFHYLHHEPDSRVHPDPNFLSHELIRAAREIGLRIALLKCAYVRAGHGRPAHPGQARFLSPDPDDFLSDVARLRSALRLAHPADAAWVGVAPHSVRAVPLEYLRAVGRYARAEQLPLHLHASEQPAENDACRAEYGCTPVALLDRHGLLTPRTTLIHAIHLTADEVAALAAGGATVCACPTSERNLGDGVVPAELFFAAGIPVALGSDSQIQIDLLEDARELEYHLRLQKLQRAVLAPDLAVRLFACATSAGARSLGAPGGELAIGRAADFFSVDLGDPSIAGAGPEALLAQAVFALERTAIRGVWVGGQPVIENGRHPLQNEVVSHFLSVQERLWKAPS